jgi:hypothetical protein
LCLGAQIKIKGGECNLTTPIQEPTEEEIKDAHEEFWRWVFRENDGDNHPLKTSSGNQTTKIQHNSLLIVAGSFPDNKPKNRLLQIPASVNYVFIPAENCVYTEADGDGSTNQELEEKANKDMADSQGKVWINDDEQKLRRLQGHTFSPLLEIQKCIEGTGHSGRGEGQSCIKGSPPGPTKAAAACDFAIIPANALKSKDIIKIKGIGRAGPDQQPGNIDVTYDVEKL